MRTLFRPAYIGLIALRHGLDILLLESFGKRGLSRLAGLLAFGRKLGASRGQRLREALEQLGPIFVKFGQMLSTRRDLLPPDVADELAKLQDRVPPFSSAESARLVEKALGKPLSAVFRQFDADPIASASIGAVFIPGPIDPMGAGGPLLTGIAHRRLRSSGQQVAKPGAQQADQIAVLAHVDQLTLAGLGPRFQRRQSADRPHQATHHIRPGIAPTTRRTVGVTHQMRQAGHGLQCRSITHAIFFRSGKSETREADLNRIGTKGTERLVIQSPILHHARREVVDNDIGLCRQTLCHLASSRQLHIQGQTLFPPIQVPGQTTATASEVRGLQMLHLDDGRPMVGKDPGGHRAGNDPGEIKHHTTLERTARRSR